MTENTYLTQNQLAAHLLVAESTLERWRFWKLSVSLSENICAAFTCPQRSPFNSSIC